MAWVNCLNYKQPIPRLETTVTEMEGRLLVLRQLPPDRTPHVSVGPIAVKHPCMPTHSLLGTWRTSGKGLSRAARRHIGFRVGTS